MSSGWPVAYSRKADRASSSPTLNNHILRVNRSFTHITGYAPEEVIGKTPALLRSGNQDAAFYLAMWNSLKHNGAWQGEIWNRDKSGHVYPEWLTINTLRDDGGSITHYIGIFDDITERTPSRRGAREASEPSGIASRGAHGRTDDLHDSRPKPPTYRRVPSSPT